MKKKLEEIELFNYEPLDSIAIVDEPAIMVDFMCFSAEKKYSFANEEKHIITGPILIPDLRILRYKKDTGEPFYIYFSKDTVEKVAHDFLSYDKNSSFNLQHSVDTDKLTMIESWIKVDEMDKSTALGIDVPVGTWLASVKVHSMPLWADIKAGKYNGFSIQGLFSKRSDDDVLLEKIKKLVEECEE